MMNVLDRERADPPEKSHARYIWLSIAYRVYAAQTCPESPLMGRILDFGNSKTVRTYRK
jgi:hypothetical protein